MIRRTLNKVDKKFWLSNSLYIAILTVIVVFSFYNPKFVTFDNISSIFKQSRIILLVGCGMSLCMLTKGIDMSVVSNMFLSAVVMWFFLDNGLGVFTCALLGICAGTLLGFVNGILVAWLKIYPMLPTLATMYVARGIALIIIAGKTGFMTDEWGRLAKYGFNGVSFCTIIVLLILILFQILLSKTSLGRQIYAIGDNEKTAQERGINVFAIRVFAYTMCGFMCALAALISTSQVMVTNPNIGTNMDFYSIIAAVLGGVSLTGGKGKIFPGVLFGALIMSSISNMLVLAQASPYLYTVVYAVVILVVVIIDVMKSSD